MKNCYFYLTILLLAFYANAQVVKTNTFELTFPAKPTSSEQEIVTEAGDTHLTMYQLQHAGSMILVLDSTYPEGLDISTDKEVNKKVLKNSKNGSVNNFASQLSLTAKVIAEVYVENKSVLALQSVDAVGSYFAQTYTIAHLNKLYSIMVFSQTEEGGKSILDNLVNSFQLKTL